MESVFERRNREGYKHQLHKGTESSRAFNHFQALRPWVTVHGLLSSAASQVHQSSHTPQRHQDPACSPGPVLQPAARISPYPFPSSPGALVTLYQRKLCAGQLSWPVRYGDFFSSCVFYGFWGATGKRKKSTFHAWYVIFKRL